MQDFKRWRLKEYLSYGEGVSEEVDQERLVTLYEFYKRVMIGIIGINLCFRKDNFCCCVDNQLMVGMVIFFVNWDGFESERLFKFEIMLWI